MTLVGSDANEKGLKYAGQQGSLRTLHLFRPFQFTEQGMAHLAGLGELQSLTITSTQIESLRGLERVPSLRHLFIDHSDFKGECFQHLQALTQLRQLRLASREVTLTDEDLIHLGSLTQLEHLAVDVSEITEEGVRHLAGLENLQSLSLAETTISADGLRHLATLNNLRSLTVKFSGKQEAAWLQQQLPGCTVRFRR
ncbi:Leucine Rich repeats (2 copies) [Roseimaritima ulvae]|uniref:Leucine Rich repeats (2 copies) n=1 Tax=Roseimaritima ulvae TaxID=980254 RepID=A0A5B9QGC8_9BACT|nr:Leucine Rich repeats (2 copies) [Roseimaritima ulvae]